ncbi:MAG: M14 family metallopeptidase [Planctomycetota bacterium]|jgi:hypothetical protein
MNRFQVVVTVLAVGAAGGAVAWARPTDDAKQARYRTHAELSTEVNRLVAQHPQSCAAESIGTSREGRAIWALRLARGGDVEPDRRPALLLAANIDGSHLLGSEIALGVAGRLLTMARDGDKAALAFLTDHAVYVVPRVNPDAAERYFDDVKTQRRLNVRPVDEDRDGAVDEDPPNDLNGDGLITMMRVFDPEKADMMPDPDEPRLAVKPDRDKGERAAFTLYAEGIDDDGDGEYNEDDLGGVDLNMNYMHGYQAHAFGAGPYQVSEPESLALLEYVLAHQNIAVVLTYGLHDNLSKPPDGKGTYPSGAPKNIDTKDVGLYKHISERFGAITGLEKAANDKSDGAFFAWAYAQFGVPSFTTPLWSRPQAEGKKEGDGPGAAEPGGGGGGGGEDGDDGDLTPSGIGDISQETLDELRASAEARGFEISDEMLTQLTPQMVESFAQRSGIKIRRVKGDKAAAAGKARNKDDAAWLAYSDEQREGSGFVAWQPFEHPQLGPVEIGGWVPYFRISPPPEEIDTIAEKQTAFVLDLAGRFPRVSLAEPEIIRLAAGLYEIKTALVNDGYLPTGTAMAVRNRRARPYVVRLSVDNERIVTGQRVNKIWAVPGSGGRQEFRWIVQIPDGTELTITVYSEKFGQFERTVWLRQNAGNAENGGAS